MRDLMTPMKTLAPIAVAGLLLATGGPAAAQGTSATVPISASVQGGYLNLARVGGSSDLVFPNTEIATTSQTVNASQAPQFLITDATGTRNGWRLTLHCTNYTSGNNSINASNARYNGRGGYTDSHADFTVQNGDAPNYSNGPRDWTNGGQALNSTPRVAYAANGWGAGTYTWTPQPSKFQIVIPPTTKGGGTTYTATYTLTLLSGP